MKYVAELRTLCGCSRRVSMVEALSVPYVQVPVMGDGARYDTLELFGLAFGAGSRTFRHEPNVGEYDPDKLVMRFTEFETECTRHEHSKAQWARFAGSMDMKLTDEEIASLVPRLVSEIGSLSKFYTLCGCTKVVGSKLNYPYPYDTYDVALSGRHPTFGRPDTYMSDVASDTSQRSFRVVVRGSIEVPGREPVPVVHLLEQDFCDGKHAARRA